MLLEHFGKQNHKPFGIVQTSNVHPVTKQVQDKLSVLGALHMRVHVHHQLVQDAFAGGVFQQG